MFKNSIRISRGYLDTEILNDILEKYYYGRVFENIDTTDMNLNDKIKITRMLIKQDTRNMRRKYIKDGIENIKAGIDEFIDMFRQL